MRPKNHDPRRAPKAGRRSVPLSAAKPAKPVQNNQRFAQARPAQRGAAPRSKPENWLYGLHAVRAALANPLRRPGRALLSQRAAEMIGPELAARARVEITDSDTIGRLLPPGAVHQGAALETPPLPRLELDTILAALDKDPNQARQIVVVLDQISDPHNVGAILRSAAAFGACAMVVQDRHAPPQSGALAKAASGALDIVPYVEAVNIARALDRLGEAGFWRIALGSDGEAPLLDVIAPGKVALVLGSEGEGIRRLVRERCDARAFIPMGGQMESLNVSNAAAIALYTLRHGLQPAET